MMPTVAETWKPPAEISDEARALGQQVERLIDLDTDNTMGYWVRGHVDLELFLDAVEWGYEIGAEGERPIRDVRHRWWRSVPVPADWDCVATRQFVEASGPGRGAFAVTVVEF